MRIDLSTRNVLSAIPTLFPSLNPLRALICEGLRKEKVGIIHLREFFDDFKC